MSDFEQFWSIYPRKVSRGAALKSYDRALKIAGHDEIMEGLGKYVSHLEDNPKEAKYTKHASTWLNQQCWLDDLGPSLSDKLVSIEAALSLKQRYEKDPAYWGRIYPDSVLKMLNIGPYKKMDA
jgi:hypothetical protein